MAKDPAFLFYSQDFLVGTATMPYEDRGKYITILAQMHQQGRMDEETICFLVGSVSVKLKSKFSVDEGGNWFNARLEEETEKRKKYTESRRINGSKGGRPKHKGKHMQNHKDTHMENVNEDVNRDKEERPKPLNSGSIEADLAYKFRNQCKSPIGQEAAIRQIESAIARGTGMLGWSRAEVVSRIEGGFAKAESRGRKIWDVLKDAVPEEKPHDPSYGIDFEKEFLNDK